MKKLRYENVKKRKNLFTLPWQVFRQFLSVLQGKISPLMGEAFWVGFGLGSSVLALLVGTRFLTTLLSTAEYGRMALAISLTTMVVQIGGNPISQTGIRFYTHWREAGKLPLLLKNLGRTLLRQIGIILFVCMAIAISAHYYDKLPSFYCIIIVGLLAISLLLNRVAFGIEDAARERCFRGVIQGSFETGRFLFAIGIIILLTAHTAEAALSGFLIAAVLALACHGIFLKKLLKPVLKSSPVGQRIITSSDASAINHFQMPLFISNACIWLVMMAERWTLQHYGNLVDVGGYAAVYQLAFMPMLLVSTFLVLFLEPIIYQYVGLDGKTDGDSQALRINFYLAVVILFVTMMIFIGFLFFHPFIGSLFLGEQFRSYSWLFPWLFLAGGFFAASQQFLLKLQSELRTGVLAGLWGVVAVTAVTAYFIGAKYWQLKGVLTAVVLVNVMLLMFSIYFSGIRKH